jgi:hypothetical protein
MAKKKMKPIITLNGSIEINSRLEQFTIEQEGDRYFCVSQAGYDNSDSEGHKSLIAAVKHVLAMIETIELDEELENEDDDLDPAGGRGLHSHV